MLGDIDGDFKVTLEDVIYVLKYIVGNKELTAEQIKNVDLNNDRKITVVDVLILQGVILEITETA